MLSPRPRNVILICRIKRDRQIVEQLRQFDDHSWNWTSLTRHLSEDELVTRKFSLHSSHSSLAASEVRAVSGSNASQIVVTVLLLDHLC